jgi:branched-chain amino acid transport system ATP-binding protein
VLSKIRSPRRGVGGGSDERPILRLNDVSVGYDGTDVVHGLGLHVERGEVVTLLGPNGAGKTTTLLAISGLLALSSGSVQIDGVSARASRPHTSARLGIAHVPDDRSLFPALTCLQNLRLGGRSLAKQEVDEAQDEVLSLFPALTPLLKRKAGLLSGGEQQMLAVARAMIWRPKLLMLDEMSHGLAPIIVKNLLAAIRKIADSGIAVLLVEQHIDLALEVADRAYVLDRGVVSLVADANELRHRSVEELRAIYLGGQEPRSEVR